MKSEVVSAVGNSKAGVTLDFWMDDNRKVSYFCPTIHYAKSASVIERVLCTAEFDRYSRRTAENVKPAIY